MAAIAASKGLSDLVGAVYDCIPDASLWQGTLDRIRTLCDGYLATLAVLDTDEKLARFSVACGDPEILEPLLSTYNSDMPFYTAVPKMELDVPQTVDSIYELDGPSTRERWLSSKMAREWAMPNKLDDFIWVPVMKQPGRIGNLVVITHKDRPQITRADIDVVSALSPHVRRAVTIGDLFESERRKGEIFRDIVDTLSHPVLIVSADMQIIFANLAAEKMLQAKQMLTSLRGELSFNFSHAHRAITKAVETGRYDEFAMGPTGINVPLANCATPSVAHVMPLAQRDPSQRIAIRAAAAIFIASAGSAPLPAMDAIAALFGLTAAEKRVATQVASGKSRRDIAEASGVSDGTVKSQLAAIFDKTNTADQRDLALLVRDLSPPLGGN
jgi:DNA-binding CsgD family transcriptional regulator/PAS domain-containing protein